MHTTIRNILDERVPTVQLGRQLAEPPVVALLRTTMRNTLRSTYDYEEHPEIALDERTVEFTADVTVSPKDAEIFAVALWDAGWRYWEIQHHEELKRVTYKLWIYPSAKATKALVTSSAILADRA